MPRSIFGKRHPFLGLQVREGSAFSEEALCMNPVALERRLNQRLRLDLGE